MTGIQTADCVLVVISEAALERPWVQKEIESAEYQQIASGKRLIPLILGMVPRDKIPISIQGMNQIRVERINGVVEPAEFELALESATRAVFEVPRDSGPTGPLPANIQNPSERLTQPWIQWV